MTALGQALKNANEKVVPWQCPIIKPGVLTDEHQHEIAAARAGNRPMSWPKISALIEQVIGVRFTPKALALHFGANCGCRP